MFSAVLAGCSLFGEQGLEAGVIGDFAGVIAADEPRAAVAGQEILAAGGTAADAAVAAFFTMSVTYPSRVGLTGGGVCLAFNSVSQSADLVEFLPRSGASGAVSPSAVRAMAALHARHGVLRWEALVSPSEGLARFGFPVSRALSQDLIQMPESFFADPEVEQIFRNKQGRKPAEGDLILAVELSGVLSGIRGRGASYFYGGDFPQRLATAAQDSGQGLTLDEVRNAVPQLSFPAVVEFGSEELYFSTPPAADGLVAAVLWQLLNEVEDYEDEDPAERAHLFIEAAQRAFAQRVGWLDGSLNSFAALDEDFLESLMANYDPDRHTPATSLTPSPRVVEESPYGASVVAGDEFGNAVACSFTMNGLFGSGRLARGTGLFLAEPVTPGQDGFLAPGVAILANTVAGDAHSAAAASGGAPAATAMVKALLGALVDDLPVRQAVAAPRLHHGGLPDVTLHEPTWPDEVLRSLEAKGHQLQEVPSLGRVNLFFCEEGLQDNDEGCLIASDPRGFGLGELAQ